MTLQTDVSIVIPTFNSSRTISECLDSIAEQTSPCKEVVVVDKFSVDDTSDIAKAKGAKVIRAKANRSEARNIGASKSSSYGVLFVDSDMLLSKNLVEDCSKRIASVDALIIPEVSVGSGFWARCKEFDKQFSVGRELAEAARCFQRTTFFSLGGYDDNLEAGEDWDLTRRARLRGLRIGRTESLVYHDEGKLQLVTALRKKYAYGKTFARYVKTHPSVAFQQVNPLTRILLPSLKAMKQDPAHGAGLFILKSLEFCSAGAGQLTSMKLSITH